MAHRRALARRRGRALWLLVPLALALDASTALGLAGHRLLLGLAIPEALLLAAPFLAYGGLAFLAFRTRPIPVRLAAAAVLLGLHAALVVAHTLLFASLWSLPVPAALRLAHRWSPLIPLLQLVWVPILALPLARLAQAPAPAPARRGGVAPSRRDVLASRGTQAGHGRRTGPDRDLAGEPGGRASAAVGTLGTMRETLPEPVSGEPSPPAAPPIAVSIVQEADTVLPSPAVAEPEPPVTVPGAIVVVHTIDEPSGAAAVLADAERVEPEPVVVRAEAGGEPTEAPAALPAPSVEPAVSLVVEESPPVHPPAIPAAPAGIDAVVVLTGDTPEPESTRAVETAPVVAVPALLRALPPAPPPAPLPPFSPLPPILATEPPLDLSIVARLFEPYGTLLSRHGTFLVDWAPHPHGAIVCVSPRDVSRRRLVHLAGRLAGALAVAGDPTALPSVRRLSLRGPDGVAVLTPLDGGILVAAARRPGAAALLEVLSARVVPGPLHVEAADTGLGDPSREIRLADAVRVATPAATLDVLAPTAADAESLGALAGRLLAAIMEHDADRTPDTLSVDLGMRCLMVHPVSPGVRPPRFVAVVGGREAPGLLWRRTERAARDLRAAS